MACTSFVTCKHCRKTVTVAACIGNRGYQESSRECPHCGMVQVWVCAEDPEEVLP